ncbi:MAG TPA: hypothetical protein VL357_01445 [Rariglobus sp.]|jgi:hypothetical protein|nr:hypothetical protein [Rariglobus sp.]
MKIYTIKILFVFGVGAACSWPVLAADTYQPAYNPQITVQVEGEIVSLARGYAAAFAQLPSGARYIIVKGKDGPVYLGSVHSVKALDGVLLIETDSGLFRAISANTIVSVTNEKPKA